MLSPLNSRPRRVHLSAYLTASSMVWNLNFWAAHELPSPCVTNTPQHGVVGAEMLGVNVSGHRRKMTSRNMLAQRTQTARTIVPGRKDGNSYKSQVCTNVATQKTCNRQYRMNQNASVTEITLQHCYNTPTYYIWLTSSGHARFRTTVRALLCCCLFVPYLFMMLVVEDLGLVEKGRVRERSLNKKKFHSSLFPQCVCVCEYHCESCISALHTWNPFFAWIFCNTVLSLQQGTLTYNGSRLYRII